jgi:hypothetical protein
LEIENISPDVPASVDSQNKNHEQDQPQVFSPSLLHLHELIHAHYQVTYVDAHTAIQPDTEVSAVILSFVENNIQGQETYQETGS